MFLNGHIKRHIEKGASLQYQILYEITNTGGSDIRKIVHKSLLPDVRPLLSETGAV